MASGTSLESLKNLKPRKKGDPAPPGAGRPKGSLNVRTIVGRLLAYKEDTTHPLTKRKCKLTQLELITLKQLEAAKNGNLAAYSALLDRYEGKPEETHNLNGAVHFIYNEPEGNAPIVDENPDIIPITEVEEVD